MEHLQIDLDKCIGCGKCAKMCMKNNIVIEDRKAKETGEGCLECSHCVSSCPKGAIRLIPRSEEDETVFSRIKKGKMFDGSMVSDDELRQLVDAMSHGERDRFEFFILDGESLDSFMDTLFDILRKKESEKRMINTFGAVRDDLGILQPNPAIWEGQQVICIFADSKEDALIASQRMFRKGLSLGIRGFHSNLIMTAYLFDRDRILEYFPNSSKEMQMAYVFGHPRRIVEPVFRPLTRFKGIFDSK